MTEVPPNAFFILAGIVVLALIWLTANVLDLKKKIGVLFGTKDGGGGNIEQETLRRLAKTEAKIENLEPRMNLLESVSKISVQKVGFLRFNPFQDTGGDQSFILVMLDRENNGVAVSSLYSREGTRLYAKEISAGKSKHPLSAEEKKVLEDTISKRIKN
ncbi:MAG: DUF4446 family protein [Candidatus Sungbacteria bacterium]|nr:DUF4446 family protein [Candidatus Sungbacteria bacterium]